MNLAMQTNTPFIELFKHGVKTGAYEDCIKSIRESLEQRGIKTDVFTTRLPTPLMCVWSEGQRRRLLKRARGYEAALVMGCSSAVTTAKEVLKGTDCRSSPTFCRFLGKGDWFDLFAAHSGSGAKVAPEQLVLAPAVLRPDPTAPVEDRTLAPDRGRRAAR